MIDDAAAIQEEMARWPDAVVLAGELRGRLLTQPAPA